jgi:hypothetical protein
MVVDSKTRAEILVLLQAEIDWDSLIRTAHQHRVLPLLYRTLAHNFPNHLPEQVMERLRRIFQANATRNLFLTEELLQVIDLLQAHDVRAISYKGLPIGAFPRGYRGSAADLPVHGSARSFRQLKTS